MTVSWLLLHAAQLSANCEVALARFNEVPIDASAERMTQALQRLERSDTCGAHALDGARRVTATRLFRLAYQGASAGMAEHRVEGLLEDSEGIVPTWRTLAFSGTRDHQRGDYTRAAKRLQGALALIDDPQHTPQAPALKTIADLHQLASESLMLADEFVPPPQVRGVASGVLAASVRGFSVRRTPLPIGFKTASTEFTEQGEAAIESLWQALQYQGSAPVEIVGHADERGDESDNMLLSQRRANRVREWLLEKGLNREVIATAKGETQPLAVSNPAAYSQSQRWQLDRRVELIRLSGAE